MMIIPGTDGQKMSKSYRNTINIFSEEKSLKKQVMQVVTDSIPLDEPKEPNKCNVFNIYKLLADNKDIQTMENNYRNGNYGYGHAKNALLELILNKFSNERKVYNELMNNTNLIEQKLLKGSEKAKNIASSVLSRVKIKLGL